MQGKVGVIFVLFLSMLLILTTLPSVLSAESTPDTHVFIEEGAEEATYEEWNARWPRYDANDDPVSGQDYWCRQMHEVHSGQRSIYCARNGINSHYLNSTGHQPWNVNLTSLPESVPQTNYVLRYETNQDAIMHKSITGAKFYNKITMTFWFWSNTGHSDAKQPGSGAEVGYDFLNAIYYTGSGENRVKHVAWTDSYEEATAMKWAQVSVDIPNNVTEVGFEFVSGTVAPEGGDAANAFSSQGITVLNGGMKEGVFLDDIAVTGTEPAPDVPLVTSVESLPAYESNRSFSVNIGDNGPKVGMKYTYLYYRMAGEEDWTKYTTADNSGGTFSVMPIKFTAPQDGEYEFFSVGVDQNDVTESVRNAADASTTVDATAPTTTASVIGDKTGDNYNGAVSVVLTGSDAASGVDHISYRVDGGPWTEYGTGVGLATNGAHDVEYYATDKAGNVEGTKSIELSIVNGAYGIVFNDPGKNFPGSDVTINFTVVTAAPVSKLAYSLDGGSFVDLEATAGSLSLTGLSAGNHDVVLKATDSSGDVVQDSVSFTVGNSGSDIGSTIGNIIANPLVIIGLVAAAVVVIGLVWRASKRKK